MREFIRRLEQRGCLLVVEKEIDPFHELATVTQLAQAAMAISPLALERYHQRLMQETTLWWLLSNQAPPV
ncbi:hypothetical protein [Sodalis glossinidius]|uniref:hypothetical protein n=1 Tax=Sodalis glossinidius TaxID=63612 RepID=UPI0002EBEBC1|nr:hypothetical protein [Sodalis glossinidius]